MNSNIIFYFLLQFIKDVLFRGRLYFWLRLRYWRLMLNDLFEHICNGIFFLFNFFLFRFLFCSFDFQTGLRTAYNVMTDWFCANIFLFKIFFWLWFD